MTFSQKIRLFVCTLAAGAALTVPGSAAENRVYFSSGKDPRLPECAASSVRGAVSGRINGAYADYTGGRKVQSVDGVRQVAYRLNGLSPVARRYCRAKARLSDGTTRTVHYLVEEHAGFVGLGWNVEACIDSLDKWWVYGGHCNTVKPR